MWLENENREEALELVYNNRDVIKTIICIEIYFKIIIVNFASFVHISMHKF